MEKKIDFENQDSFAGIIFKMKNATQEEIDSHLRVCSGNFSPSLNEKVNINEYSQKIFERATTFEAWSSDTLVGLVAAYFNDFENHIGYITHVSVMSAYQGIGIASELVKECIKYAEQNQFKEIHLEVRKDNSLAIQLYKEIGFMDFEEKDDSVLMKFEI